MGSPSWRTRLFHWYFLFSRPMTLGVRVIVCDDKNRVLMVRHTYVKGWHLPGGGVEKGETALKTVAKELVEETGIEPVETPQLLAVFANRRASKRDHVLLYRCYEWTKVRAFVPTNEIAQTGFFSLDELPDETTEPTRQRLSEVFENQPISETW